MPKAGKGSGGNNGGGKGSRPAAGTAKPSPPKGGTTPPPNLPSKVPYAKSGGGRYSGPPANPTGGGA
jgi:hypothetical protein